MPSEKPVKVTDSNFHEFIRKHPFTIVDFWAPWCIPCLMLSPTIDSLAKDYAGKVAFGKLNVDENRKACEECDVRAIPTLLFFKNGKLTDRMVGVAPRADIEEKIRKYL